VCDDIHSRACSRDMGERRHFCRRADLLARNLASHVHSANACLVLLGLVVAAIPHRVAIGQDSAGRYFSLCGGAALLQLVIVLIVFSYSANRELRYLLPLLPSAALVVCWAVAHFGSRLLTGLAVIAFAGQLGLMWGYIFHVPLPAPHFVVRVIERDGQDAR